MARPAVARWHERSRCWVSAVGEVGKSGRRKPVYFRDIPYGPPRSPAWKAAQRALDGYLAARVETIVPSADPTVYEVCRLHHAHAKEAKAARTAKDRGYHLEVWCNFAPPGGAPYGARKAASIRAEDFELFGRSLTRSGKAPRYVASIQRSVKAAWAWAARPVADRDPRQLIPSDPVAGLAHPVIHQNPIKYVEPDVVAKFLAWLEAETRGSPGRSGRFDRLTVMLVRLIAETGCRPGEAAAATWDQVDWSGARIVQKTHKTSGKTGRPRIIHLSPIVVADLRRIDALEGRHPSWIFTHRKGRHGPARDEAGATAGDPWDVQALGFRVRKWRQKARAAGVDLPADFSLYTLRHAWAADALMSGMSPAEVGALLGTSARMIEQVYGSMSSEHLADLARRVRERREAN